MGTVSTNFGRLLPLRLRVQSLRRREVAHPDGSRLNITSYSYNGLGRVTSVSIPNGMTMAYGYDGRHRLTKIEHKDGSTVLDGYTYSLTAGGNVTRIDQADGSYWTYAYDGRGRLTTAHRYHAPGSGIQATYTYTYDLGDNLISKSEPFIDDFDDGNHNGWTVSGTWSAANGYVTRTSAPFGAFYRSQSDRDIDLRFRFRLPNAGDELNMYLRYVDANNGTFLDLADNDVRIAKKAGGVWTDLDTNTGVDLTPGTWYTVRALCAGAHIRVWLGEDGGPLELILETPAAPTTNPTRIVFQSPDNTTFHLDDIRVIGGSLANTATSFAVNSANELTSTTRLGVTTNFGYDAWGRMTLKTRGGYSASYAWHYGGKLTQVTSTFPGEGTVTYAYGGDQKRRERDDGTITKYNWDAGWNLINEENSGGTLTMTYVRAPLGPVGPVLADLAGSTPSSGTAHYYGLDHLGSTRSLWAANKSSLGSYEYTPYGESYAELGANSLLRFTGHQWDETSGLSFTPYRYYSSGLARWVSRDPSAMVDGPNLYSYARQSPSRYMDRMDAQSETYGLGGFRAILEAEVRWDVVYW